QRPLEQGDRVGAGDAPLLGGLGQPGVPAAQRDPGARPGLQRLPPAALRAAPGDLVVLRRQHRVAHQRHQLRLPGHMPVERHHGDPELPGDAPHGDGGQPFGVGQPDRGAHDQPGAQPAPGPLPPEQFGAALRIRHLDPLPVCTVYQTCTAHTSLKGQRMFFVDPSGDDSGPGTAERPFGTLERAREAAGPGDTVVLRGGVHRLDRTLLLTEADSGVTYRAHGYGTPEQEEVVLRGGRRGPGWRAGPGGTLLADSPGPDVRRLRIGRRTAERASVPIEGGFTRTGTGYLFDDPAVAEWGDGVEFVYRGVYPWSEARCPVARIRRGGGAAAVEMAQPAFERAARLYRSVGDWDGQRHQEHNGADSPTTAENSPAFLTEGTFALAGGVLHYLPLPGERPGEATAPVLETLLHVRGARDVSFLGLSFADAAWSRPGSPGGFLHYHGNGHYDGGS